MSEKIYDIIAEIEFDTITSDTLFIRGGRSNYILESDYPELNLKFPNAQIHSIEESGHWVHAEAPEEFYNTVIDFLKN